MSRSRKIRRTWMSQPTLEGAGVHLRRAFGHAEVPQFDPFLLMDDFRARKPEEYLAGFPWHPHRGIETITYVLKGRVEHGDSLGNSGAISSGDVQWMTAGRGVIHQEMPKGDARGAMEGFQLWANLPARQKMMPPRYQEVKAGDIPEVEVEGGARVRLICGRAGGAEGPVRGIVIEPEYLDVTVPARATFSHPVKRGHTAFAYGIGGKGAFGEGDAVVGNHTLALFEDGEAVEARAGDGDFRFLLVSGRPLGEPVAWYGPIVMNTREEIETAFEEYRQGTFIR